MTWADVGEWLKQLAIVGLPSGAVASYGVFKYVGTKWLDEKFTTRLEKLRHTQALELEHVRSEIQSTFSRITKIHEKEFEVLPKAWFMLHDAHGSAAISVGGAFSPGIDFDHMPDELLEEFLTTRSRLTPFQQNEIRSASKADRDGIYGRAIYGINMDEALEKYRLFNNYIIENRIFLTDEVYSRIKVVGDDISLGLQSFRHGKGIDFKLEHEGLKMILGLNEKIKNVEIAIQDRLHPKAAET